MGPSFLPFPQLLPLAIAECPGPQLTLCRHAHERNARVVVAFFLFPHLSPMTQIADSYEATRFPRTLFNYVNRTISTVCHVVIYRMCDGCVRVVPVFIRLSDQMG